MTTRKYLAAALCIYSCPAASETFHNELTLLSGYNESENRIWESDVWVESIGYTYYFKPVDNKRGLLTEAAFLDKASSVTSVMTHGSQEYRTKPLYPVEDFTNSTNQINLSGRAIVLEKWILDFEYADYLSDESKENQKLSFSSGLYIVDYSTLLLSVSRSRIDFENSENLDLDSIAINSKTLFQLDSGQTVRLLGAFSRIKQEDFDAQKELSISLTFFPNKLLGIGTDYKRNKNDDIEHNVYAAFVDYFFTSKLNIEARYSHSESDDAGQLESDQMSLMFSGRF